MKLKNSVVLNQTFFLILLSVIFASSMMMVWLTYMNRQFDNEKKVKDLTKNASSIAQTISDFEQAKLEAESLQRILTESPNLLNAAIYIDLNRETSWAKAYFPENSFWEQVSTTKIESLVTLYRANIFEGNNVVFSSEFTNEKNTKDNIVFVGTPIQLPLQQGNLVENIGSVYVIKNFSEDYKNLTPIIWAFIASLCLTLGMMFFPAIYVINRIVSPLFEIRDIAQNLADGKFEKHLEEQKYEAEFKELSTSINTMSTSLQNTFSALASEGERLTQILNTLNEGIIACSSSLTLTHINPMFQKYFKDEDELQIGGSIKALKNPQLLQEILYVHQTGKEKQLHIVKGDTIFQVYLLPIFPQGLSNTGEENEEACPLVCLFKDVTQEERLEQTRKDYVANVSHELKTPITALRCLIEPLMDGIIYKEEDLQKYYSLLYNEALRLSRLIDDILELSRLQSGKLSLRKDVFELSTLLFSIKSKLNPIMNEKGITFQLNLPLAELPSVWIDLDRVEQILYILLDNAMKFTAVNGKIEILGEQDDTHYYLTVKDNGIGISEEDQEHIFERFYKADKSRGKTGTGLGLSIAKEIMDQMGESIRVQSTLGEGTSFTLSLPLVKEDMPAEDQADLVAKPLLQSVKRIL